ncbi:MAG: hypothetical protein ACRD2S_07845 [Terriglobales bacterium]
MTSNSRYSMLDSMDIRCSRCGYENNPQFRFCGMCGAALRPQDPDQPEEDRKTDVATEGNIISQRLREHGVAPADPMPVEPLIAELTAAQKIQAEQTARSYSRESRDEYPQEPFHGQRSPVPVTGPSFLGLSDGGDDRRVEYLLEDEPHQGRMGKVIGTLLVLAIIGGGLFYWRKAGYPWPPSVLHTATQSPPPNSTAGSSSSSGNNGGETSSAATPPAASPEESAKPQAEPGNAPATSDAGMKASAPDTSEAQSSENTTPADKTSDTASNSVESKPPTTPPLEEKTPAPESAKSEVAKPIPSRLRASKSSPAAAAIPNPAEDSTFLEGQKYLYGTGGVASNCPRALQYLTTSAGNNNSKAQSTLATMYATGHCVPRDLPLAYRWFARALHQDPRNTRLDRDVEIMWNQMTPQEKQLALKNE